MDLASRSPPTPPPPAPPPPPFSASCSKVQKQVVSPYYPPLSSPPLLPLHTPKRQGLVLPNTAFGHLDIGGASERQPQRLVCNQSLLSFDHSAPGLRLDNVPDSTLKPIGYEAKSRTQAPKNVIEAVPKEVKESALMTMPKKETDHCNERHVDGILKIISSELESRQTADKPLWVPRPLTSCGDNSGNRSNNTSSGSGQSYNNNSNYIIIRTSFWDSKNNSSRKNSKTLWNNARSPGCHYNNSKNNNNNNNNMSNSYYMNNLMEHTANMSPKDIDAAQMYAIYGEAFFEMPEGRRYNCSLMPTLPDFAEPNLTTSAIPRSRLTNWKSGGHLPQKMQWEPMGAYRTTPSAAPSITADTIMPTSSSSTAFTAKAQVLAPASNDSNLYTKNFPPLPAPKRGF